MNKKLFPYYLSRALLSAVVAILLFGLSWQALVAGLVFFGLFLFYLHSGWFAIDETRPLFPLRRDAFGREAQRQALILALATVAVLYLVLSRVLGASPGSTASILLPVGAVVYFLAEWIFFARAHR